MIWNNFEYFLILLILIIICIVNIINIYNEDDSFIVYKKLSFLFLLSTIIFVLSFIIRIKCSKSKNVKFSQYFIESDSNDSNDSNDTDDLITDYETEIFIEN